MKKPRKLPNVIKARKEIGYRIAEQIGRKLRIGNFVEWDLDRAALIAESMVPLSNVEAQAEYDLLEEEEEKRAKEKPKRPSVIDRLRKALGPNGGSLSAMQAIEAAIERLEKGGVGTASLEKQP
jgi:hypothetical protein